MVFVLEGFHDSHGGPFALGARAVLSRHLGEELHVLQAGEGHAQPVRLGQTHTRPALSRRAAQMAQYHDVMVHAQQAQRPVP